MFEWNFDFYRTCNTVTRFTSFYFDNFHVKIFQNLDLHALSKTVPSLCGQSCLETQSRHSDLF